MTQEDTLKDLSGKYSRLSKGHKRIADYVMGNYDKVIFMTVHELSETVGISESTVVRFAHSLGYDGYPSFQKSLQESIKNRLTTLQRLEHMHTGQQEGNVITKIMHSDIRNIQDTITNLSLDRMTDIANTIQHAEHVYIYGLRSSRILADYLAFYLKFMHSSVTVLPQGVNDTYDELINIQSRDVMIAISFPRYSTHTITAIEHLKSKKVEVIGITDSYQSPIARIADKFLLANFNVDTFVDSLTAPISLINALIIAMSLGCKENMGKRFNELEELWKNQGTYL